MHPNEALLVKFYTGFQQHDGAVMAACYHPQIHFSDPVFANLKGEQAKSMWLMLAAVAKDAVVTFRDIHADDQSGSAHWEATYTFSATGRKVHNIIDSAFKFQDGLIIDQHDTFNFWRWSSQALGTPGQILGWTPFLQGRVQQQSMTRLDAFMAKRAGR